VELGKIGIWRHIVVGVSIALCAALALLGFVGGGDRDERFEAKQVTVRPEGDDGVRVREVVDIDFGTNDRRGYQREIPNDFGVPTDVVASSPDAPDDVSVTDLGFETRIRVGDPDVTITGQHRYELEYTLPDARLSSGQLALDVIGNEETFETGRFELVVTGLALDDPLCNVGAFGASGGCVLEPAGDDYVAVISPLEPGQGITIGGTIVGRTEPVLPDPPPLPERRPDRRGVVALAMIPLGLLGAGAVYLRSRHRGRNEVFAGGAAEAAYGTLPAPGSAATAATTMVPDDQMDELATIEFVPPKGLEPWQGRALLTERVDDETVAAWFSGLAGAGIVELERDGDELEMKPGPNLARADAETAATVNAILGGTGSFAFGTYSSRFAKQWSEVKRRQDEQVRTSGWWRHLPATATSGGAGMAWLVMAFVALALFGFGSVISAAFGLFSSIPGAVIFGLAVPAVTALTVYAVMLPSRSATGSALTLRTESFRRFLAASEAKYVEWAWQHGLLREYSAWAVALDEADAWGDALARANVPPADTGLAAPLLLHTMGPSLRSSHTAPSSSGSGGSGFGGGGGFSGGSVGGGGGGGSSGSW
jgi:uncharacterized membrane protein YgcG